MARKITLHFYRHGEKDKEGMLTPKGLEQAASAGKALVENLRKEGDIVVKCISTSLPRAIQTRDQFERTIEDANIPSVEIAKPHIRRTMGDMDIRDKLHPWWTEAKKSKDLLEFWLRNPEPAAVETPAEASARLSVILKIVNRIAQRLEAGKPVHYVFVGHNDISALVEFVSGKTISQLGGPLEYCEKINFEFDGNKIWMGFRGEKYEVKLE
jgi:broad specificity phosphatase PhoE